MGLVLKVAKTEVEARAVVVTKRTVGRKLLE
jgi:hypothetical protein